MMVVSLILSYYVEVMIALITVMIIFNWDKPIRWCRSYYTDSLFRGGSFARQGVYIGQKDYELALFLFRKAADRGDSNAMNALGFMYQNGEGIDINLIEAAKWFRLSANRNNALAQFNLGILYLEGKGVIKSMKEAIRWLQLSSNNGNGGAMRVLAEIYGNRYGHCGVAINQNEVNQLYKLGAEKNDACAQYQYGLLFYAGEIKNYSEAAKWCRLAAGQSHREAMDLLGFMYQNGQGVQINLPEGAKWHRLSAEKGNPSAQYNIGICYLEGNGVSKDINEGIRWLKLSAGNEYVTAINKLGDIYYFGHYGILIDYNEAFRCWKFVADKGNMLSQFNIGICYMNGQGVMKDINEGLRFFKLSAEAGHDPAKKAYDDAVKGLGDIYYYGRGVSIDYNQAVRLYKLNAENGDSEAQFRFGKCYSDGKGIEKNQQLAVFWWKKAFEGGELKAAEYLANCYEKGDGVERDLNEAIYLYEYALKQSAQSSATRLPLPSIVSIRRRLLTLYRWGSEGLAELFIDDQ